MGHSTTLLRPNDVTTNDISVNVITAIDIKFNVKIEATSNDIIMNVSSVVTSNDIILNVSSVTTSNDINVSDVVNVGRQRHTFEVHIRLRRQIWMNELSQRHDSVHRDRLTRRHASISMIHFLHSIFMQIHRIKSSRTGPVIVAQLVEQSLLKSRDMQFESGHGEIVFTV